MICNSLVGRSLSLVKRSRRATMPSRPFPSGHVLLIAGCSISVHRSGMARWYPPMWSTIHPASPQSVRDGSHATVRPFACGGVLGLSPQARLNPVGGPSVRSRPLGEECIGIHVCSMIDPIPMRAPLQPWRRSRPGRITIALGAFPAVATAAHLQFSNHVREMHVRSPSRAHRRRITKKRDNNPRGQRCSTRAAGLMLPDCAAFTSILPRSAHTRTNRRQRCLPCTFIKITAQGHGPPTPFSRPPSTPPRKSPADTREMLRQHR
jgi:hypothetical protein